MTAILVDTIENPSASIPEATDGAFGQVKATYRFYDNSRVTSPLLQQGFAADTARRCFDQDVVLVVQDTTSLNLTGLNCIPELGPIDSGSQARGVLVHTALAVTTSGQVIGPLDQQIWARPQPGQPGPEEKESGKWINGLDSARASVYAAARNRPTPRLVHVMDREGDAYEVMMAVVDAGDSAIIRCAQNRKVEGPIAKAHEAVRGQPMLTSAEIPIDRKKGVPQRVAHVEVRSMRVTLVPNPEKYPYAVAMTWTLVEVWEQHCPDGAERVHWRLWTLEPAKTVAEVLEVVRKYTCRWPIEEVHLVIKSGCQTEALRLRTWDRLEKAIRVNMAVAARIVLLRDVARETPEVPAMGVLESDEVEALVSHFHTTKAIVPSALTIGQAVLWIGRLGGHLNRKSDGMPGVRTLGRGLHNLSLLVAGFRAARRIRE